MYIWISSRRGIKRADMESSGIAMGVSGSELSQLSSARFDISHVAVWSNKGRMTNFFQPNGSKTYVPMCSLHMLQKHHHKPSAIYTKSWDLHTRFALSALCFTSGIGRLVRFLISHSCSVAVKIKISPIGEYQPGTVTLLSFYVLWYSFIISLLRRE